MWHNCFCDMEIFINFRYVESCLCSHSSEENSEIQHVFVIQQLLTLLGVVDLSDEVGRYLQCSILWMEILQLLFSSSVSNNNCTVTWRHNWKWNLYGELHIIKQTGVLFVVYKKIANYFKGNRKLIQTRGVWSKQALRKQWSIWII